MASENIEYLPLVEASNYDEQIADRVFPEGPYVEAGYANEVSERSVGSGCQRADL